MSEPERIAAQMLLVPEPGLSREQGELKVAPALMAELMEQVNREPDRRLVPNHRDDGELKIVCTPLDDDDGTVLYLLTGWAVPKGWTGGHATGHEKPRTLQQVIEGVWPP